MQINTEPYAGIPLEPSPLTMGQCEGLGNQQERLKDLAWLGGIMDGEGCITVSIKGQGRFRQYAHPNINITNTDDLIIRKVISILRQNEIAHHAYYIPAKGVAKAKTNIAILGHKRAVRFFKLIMPFLVGKKEKAILLLSFVESRLAKGPGIVLSESEREYCRQIWKLNGRGTNHFPVESSETLRSAPEKDEDKVRLSVKIDG